MLKHTKPLADTLTVTRVILGLGIAGLGWAQGKSALPTVVCAVIVSWLTDLLDGPLARRDEAWRATWVGEHDAEADLAISLGIAAYLVLSGYLAALIGEGLVLTILLLWCLHSHQLAWPFYALPYVLLLRAALREAPVLGWLIVAYLGMTLLLRWRRLIGEFLPQFFEAVGSLRSPHNNRASDAGIKDSIRGGKMP